jgi:hypothetical protein
VGLSVDVRTSTLPPQHPGNPDPTREERPPDWPKGDALLDLLTGLRHFPCEAPYVLVVIAVEKQLRNGVERRAVLVPAGALDEDGPRREPQFADGARAPRRGRQRTWSPRRCGQAEAREHGLRRHFEHGSVGDVLRPLPQASHAPCRFLVKGAWVRGRVLVAHLILDRNRKRGGPSDEHGPRPHRQTPAGPARRTGSRPVQRRRQASRMA